MPPAKIVFCGDDCGPVPDVGPQPTSSPVFASAPTPAPAPAPAPAPVAEAVGVEGPVPVTRFGVWSWCGRVADSSRLIVSENKTRKLLNKSEILLNY